MADMKSIEENLVSETNTWAQSKKLIHLSKDTNESEVVAEDIFLKAKATVKPAIRTGELGQ